MEHAFVAAIRAYYSNGVDFIEPLDVSTIFGNGLDNAIEASEKLPEEQRAILVKAGKMQNFFSVLIENNCLQDSGNTKSRTTKMIFFTVSVFLICEKPLRNMMVS